MFYIVILIYWTVDNRRVFEYIVGKERSAASDIPGPNVFTVFWKMDCGQTPIIFHSGIVVKPME